MSSKYGRANPLLTRLSLARRNAAVGYVADFVAPTISVNPSFGEYYVFDQGNNFQNPDNQKASGGVSRDITFKASVANYKTEQYGSRAWYTQKELDDFGDASALRVAKMNMVTDADMNAHEVRAAGLVTTAASYAAANKTTLTGTDRWSDFDNSDPFGDVVTAKQAVHSGDAVRANAMVVSFDTHHKLIQHPDILSRIQAEQKASGLGDVTAQKIGNLFGLDYRVAEAQYRSSDEGQTFTSAYAWGNFALIFHRAPSPAKEIYSLAYTFTYNNFQMRTYFDEPSKRFYVDNDHDNVTKLVGASAGYLITNPIA